MTAGAFGLILLSAFLHAVWNGLLKRQGPDSIRDATVGVLAVAGVAAAAAVPLSAGPPFATAASLAWGAGAGVGEAGYFLTLALALRHAPLGTAYTVARGTALLLVWPVSLLWLKEGLTPASAAGAGLVAVGIAATSFQGGLRGPEARAGVLWAVACGGFVAVYHLCGKVSLAAGAQPAALFAVSLAVAAPVNLLALGRGAAGRVRDCFRRTPWAVAGAGLLCTVSFVLFLHGLSLSGAGAALTLRNTSVLFAQLIAWAIGERPTFRSAIGALLVFAGAALLGWPR